MKVNTLIQAVLDDSTCAVCSALHGASAAKNGLPPWEHCSNATDAQGRTLDPCGCRCFAVHELEALDECPRCGKAHESLPLTKFIRDIEIPVNQAKDVTVSTLFNYFAQCPNTEEPILVWSAPDLGDAL